MKQLGFHMLWGKEQSDGTTLVGIAVKDGRARVLELPGLPKEWLERVVAALWTPAVGVSVVLVSMYGFTSPTAAQKTSLNHLLLWLLELSEEKGAVQWMIGGDLNVQLHELPATYWLAATGWKDVHDGATCVAARTIRARRIDAVLCNRHVQSRIKEVELIWDAGFPVHAVQLVKVQGGPPPKHRVWKAGRQYGEEVLPKKEHQGLASNLLRSTRSDWDKACGGQCDVGHH